MWKLVIEDDEGKRTVVPLTRDDYTVGRKEGNTIRLTERNVSRDHAKLHRKKLNGAGAGATHTQYMLEDLTSYNGVYVNGLRVASTQELVHGDLIQIGDYRMVLQDDQVVEAPTAVPSISADAKTTIPAAQVNRGASLMERPNRLVMLAGPTPGAEFPLDRERLTVGRAEDATISVNHNSVSRLHCEIHLLGEARYEIVDKGSSNGVRVNGAELKRGIIEAGDVIELGDVKFKFVGAGQIFLPGVNDSQQLATIGDRAVPPRPPRKSSILPYVLLGAFVAGALVVVWAWVQHRTQVTTPTPTITSETPLSHDQAIVDAARSLADSNNLDGAHTKLLDVTTDTMRSSPEFMSIEIRWAQDQITRAGAEIDPSKKRAMLSLVAQDTLLKDNPLRTTASDMIAAIDKQPTPLVATGSTSASPSATREAGLALAVPGTTARPDPQTPPTNTGRRPPPTPPTTPTPEPGTATATPAVKPPPTRSATDQAREALLTNPGLAKTLLMPIVASGKGTPEDIRLLKAACEGLKDRSCLDFLRGH